MKILITGAAGFIGSNFIYYMIEKYRKYEYICLDALTYSGNLRTLEGALQHSNVTFIKGNICDRDSIFDLFKESDFDIVVNFAAESHVDRSINNPQIFLMSNIIGTQNLMDASLKYNVKRFHQVSTDEVYGDLPLNRKDMLFTEETPLQTSSPYSASKASADLLAQAYLRTYGLPLTISRCSNNYGAYQFPEKFIPLMILNALRDIPLPIYGKGENIRDWLYVKDHCSAIDMILHSNHIGEIYNIGGDNEKSNLDVAKVILKELNKPEDLITFVQDRAGHDLRYAINSSKIQNNLGWLPSIGFDDGIVLTIRWYLDNRMWWEEILSGKYQDLNSHK